MQQALTRRFRRAAEARDPAADTAADTAADADGTVAGAGTAGREVAAGDGAPGAGIGAPAASAADSPSGSGRESPPAAAEPKPASRPAGVLPDLLLIDGGAGQVAQARAVLASLGIRAAPGPGEPGVMIVGVAKGEERRAGHERLLLPDGRELRPGTDSAGLQLIQQVRDEAHRFAITGHRGRRQKARSVSRLEDIPGIGPRRRASLLKHFGGLAGLKAAGIEEIARVEGVNAALAGRIYATLHGLQDAAPPGTPPSSK